MYGSWSFTRKLTFRGGAPRHRENPGGYWTGAALQRAEIGAIHGSNQKEEKT